MRHVRSRLPPATLERGGLLHSSLVFGSFSFQERETVGVPLGPDAGSATEHKRVPGLVRVFIMAAVLCLGLAAPARASLITVQFSGVITYEAVSGVIAPGVSVGDPFQITMGWGDFGVESVTFSLGTTVTGWAAGCFSCLTPFPSALPATTFNFYGGGFTGLPVSVPIGPPANPWVQWPGGGWHTLFSLTLASGWQSGSMHIRPENAFLNAPVEGTVTRMARVPEPGTVLTLSLGVCALAVLRRARRMRMACQP